jgi:hypothetical protein
MSSCDAESDGDAAANIHIAIESRRRRRRLAPIINFGEFVLFLVFVGQGGEFFWGDVFDVELEHTEGVKLVGIALTRWEWAIQHLAGANAPTEKLLKAARRGARRYHQLVGHSVWIFF